MNDEVHDYIRYWRERAIKAEDENARLKAEIADLKEKNRWIPISERMPEKPGWYPVWYVYNGKIELQEEEWFCNGCWRPSELAEGEITYWHYPLPEPPQEVEG